MNHGGEASEQIVRIALEGTEVALKLTGSATKNVAAALYAIYKDKKKFKSGQGSLAEMLKDGQETRIFRIDIKKLAEFKRYAKKFGIRYAAIKEKDSKDNICDVIIRAKDIPRVNHVLGKMDYVDMSPPEPVQQDQSDLKKGDQQRNSSTMQKTKSEQSSKETIDIETVLKDIKENNKGNITPEKYKAYLDLQSQMYSYSAKNQERIFEQLPSASVVMSKTKLREIGRYPKVDAKGIFIKMPEYKDGNRTGNFIDVKVYDISDTYGKDIEKSSIGIKLENNTPEIKAEIDRIRTSCPVPIETKSDINTNAYYNSMDKKIYIKDNLSDIDTYKAIVLEQSYANAHQQHGSEYVRNNHRLMAESTAYMVASKYGMDTQEFRFDYIPDEINGADGKDLMELFNPVVNNGSSEVRKSDKNLSKFKSKDKSSVIVDLHEHKKAIDNNSYVGKKSEVKAPKIPFNPKDK